MTVTKIAYFGRALACCQFSLKIGRFGVISEKSDNSGLLTRVAVVNKMHSRRNLVTDVGATKD